MSEFITDTTEATFEADVLQSDLPVLLDLWAPWCGPCKALAPHLERIAKEHQGRLRVVKCDVDQYADVRTRFSVRGIPTLLLFRAGAEVVRAVGGSPAQLRALVTTALLNPGGGVCSGSFDGDANKKADCTARLESAISGGRLVKGTDSAVDWTPSMYAGADDSAELRVPSALAVLLDLVFLRLPPDGSDVRFARESLEAIPVGSDLGKVPGNFAKWLVNDPVWGVKRWALEPNSEGARLPQAIVGLHSRYAEGVPVSQKEWTALRDQFQAARSAQQPGVRQMSGGLMNFTQPLDDPDGVKLVELLDGLNWLAENNLRLNWASGSEEMVSFEARRRLATERVAALGPRPSGDDEMLKTYSEQIAAINQEFLGAFEAVYPGYLERRQRESDEAVKRQSAEFYAAQAQALLNLLRTAPEASVG